MNVTPIAILGQYEKDNNLYPTARILNDDQNIAFDAAFVAGSFVSLFEAFLSHVPENQQIEFEQNFKNALTAMLNNKEQYKIKFHDHEN